MIVDSVHAPKATAVELAQSALLRFVALACLWFGLNYWAMLVGFSSGGAGRFDLLPPAWKAAATALAVLFPVAAIGLWLLVSWGPVIWVLAAATEITMYQVYPDIFGAKPWVVFFHAGVAIVFVLLRIALFIERRSRAKKRGRVRVDSP